VLDVRLECALDVHDLVRLRGDEHPDLRGHFGGYRKIEGGGSQFFMVFLLTKNRW
jgi:hypothetical protein